VYFPSHIPPYMSKSRLLLETDDETNGLYLQWVPCIPKTTAQDVPLLIQNLLRGDLGAKERVLFICLKEVSNQGGSTPRETPGAHK